MPRIVAPPTPTLTAAQLLRLVGNAERIQLLRCFESIGGELPEFSAKQVSAARGWPLSNTAYHLTELRDAGLVERVRWEQRRGAREHFCQLTDLGEQALDLIEHAENITGS